MSSTRTCVMSDCLYRVCVCNSCISEFKCVCVYVRLCAILQCTFAEGISNSIAIELVFDLALIFFFVWKKFPSTRRQIKRKRMEEENWKDSCKINNKMCGYVCVWLCNLACMGLYGCVCSVRDMYFVFVSYKIVVPNERERIWPND